MWKADSSKQSRLLDGAVSCNISHQQFGKGIVPDEYVRDVTQRAIYKVARVGECTTEPAMAATSAITVGTAEDIYGAQ